MQDQIVNGYTQLLVARYLKENGFEESLAGFLKETSLSKHALLEVDHLNQDKSEDLTTIIRERIEYNEYNVEEELRSLSLNNATDQPIDVAKFGITKWNHNVTWTAEAHITTSVLPLGSKFLNSNINKDIAVSIANKQLLIYKDRLKKVKHTLKPKSVIKLFGSVDSISSSLNYACTMDGSLYLFSESATALENAYRIHQRMVTHIHFIPIEPKKKEFLIVSTGMDQILKVSLLKIGSSCVDIHISEIDSIRLKSNCSSLACQYMNSQLSMFLTRNDFTQIVCYKFDPVNKKLNHDYSIALNNTQFSTHSFNVRDLTLINDRVLAVATSHIPYLRVLLVEVPSNHDSNPEPGCSEVKTYYDKVLMNIATQITNSTLSQPIIKYLPISNGLLIGNDDGLFAMDLQNYDSWSLADKLNLSNPRIVKNIDVSPDGHNVICTFSNKSVYLWSIKE